MVDLTCQMGGAGRGREGQSGAMIFSAVEVAVADR